MSLHGGIKFFVLFIFIQFTSLIAKANSSDLIMSFYNQSVFLEKYDNIINQSILRLTWLNKDLEYYTGIYFDNDNKSNNKITYTDKQVSPLIGVQSQLQFPTFPMRFFAELRDVNRIGNFPDKRAKQTTEVRAGGLGYNFVNFDQFFNEYYFAIFMSQLYDQKVLAQGWNKTGYRWSKQKIHFDIFNEALGDSFDLTKEEQMTIDLRPGIRILGASGIGTIQLLAQHLIPIDQSGRPNETRVTFVFYLQQ